MVLKIGICGLPSVGKTSCMTFLYNYLKSYTPVELVSEYAREFIIENKGIKTIKNQLQVTHTQAMREYYALKRKPEILLTEAPIFSGLPYAKTYFCNTPKDYQTYCEINRIASVFKYDIIIWCNPFGKYIKDGVRYQKEEELPYLQEEIRENMYMFHKGDIITLPKTIQARERTLKELAEQILKGEYK